MRPATRFALLAILLALHVVPGPPALLAGPEDEAAPAQLKEEAVALHGRAREGDEAAAAGAVERLERYLAQAPEDGEAWAYLGSAYAMRGRDASTIINKMRYTNRGLRHLDRALEIAPGSFVVRFIGANVNAKVPEMFGRGERATADMLALDEIFHAAPSPARARMMVGIYEELRARAPEAGPWEERLRGARAAAGGG